MRDEYGQKTLCTCMTYDNDPVIMLSNTLIKAFT